MKHILIAFWFIQVSTMVLMPGLVHGNELETTAKAIRSARIFTSPIEWVGESEPADADSTALQEALRAFERTGAQAGYEAIEGYLTKDSQSPWAPSLRVHLAERYRVMGRYTAAIRHWEQAWQSTKSSVDPTANKVAARALAGWLGLLGSLGRRDEMDVLMVESGRLGVLDSQYASAIRSSLEGLSVMKMRPEDAFRCGSLALGEMMRSIDEKNLPWRAVKETPSPEGGFDLKHLVSLAASNQFQVVAIRREANGSIPVPSVVHWKLDHYAAIVEEKAGKYKVVDPTFGTHKWLDAQTINEEASGHFLVSGSNRQPGEKPLSDKEASRIHGKGNTQGANDDEDNSGDDDDDDDCDPPGSNDGPEGGGEPCPADAGMPVWSISDPFMTLWVHDTPLYYRNARGGWEKLRLSYKHRTVPRNDTVAGFGEGWECNWIGFLEADSADTTTVKNYLAGGGIIKFATSGTNDYHSSRELIVSGAGVPEKIVSPGPSGSGGGGSSVIASSARGGISAGADGGRSVVPSPKANPIGGSENRYGAAVSYGAGITRYFRTNQVDRYDRRKTYSFSTVTVSGTAYYRLTNRVDKDGRASTLAYTNTTFPRLITAVTDPYGRTARFIYDQSGRLTNIIDMAGLSTSFRYHTDGSMTNMVTPNGTSSFKYYYKAGSYGNWKRGVEVTEPGGLKQLSTYHDGASNNTNLNIYAWHHMHSYHWNRAQYAAVSALGKSDPMDSMTVADFDLAPGTEWMRTDVYASIANVSSTPWRRWDPADPQNSNKRNNVVQFTYPNQGDIGYNVVGPMKRPNKIAWSDELNVSPRDETQIPRNVWGRPTEIRYLRNNTIVSFTNKFDADGRRLLEVWGPNAERIRGYGYDTTRTNLLLSVTNALNEVIRYTYDSSARVTSIRHPGGLVTTNFYYTSGAQTGFLLTRIELGIRTNHYAWTNGNLEWHTNELGLATRQMWDSLNRVSSVVYPDGTTVSNVYKNLDLIATKDRLNQWAYFGYNRVHQMVAQTNVNGQVTQWDYCGCGAPSQITVWNGGSPSITSFSYTMAGRLTNVVYPDGHSLSYQYDPGARLTKVTEPDGRQVQLTYASQNKISFVSIYNINSYEGGNVLMQEYDAYGRVSKVTDRNYISITNGYDLLGRLVVRATLDASGYLSNTVSYAHSPVGVTNATDELGRNTKFVHDAAGRLLFQTNANNEILRFTYNPADQMLTFTDGNNQQTRWNYDSYGHVTNKLDANGTAIFRYKYDALDRLTNRWTPAKGDTFYSFDPIGNLTAVDYPGSLMDRVFQYDGLNRLTNVMEFIDSIIGINSFTYNAAGQMTSEDGPWADDTITNSYNNRLRTGLSLAQPNALPWTVAYGYDQSHRLTNVMSAAGSFLHVYRSIYARLSDQLQYRGLGGTAYYYQSNYVNYGYDDLARLTFTELRNNAGTVLNKHGYQMDAAGQRTRQTVSWGDAWSNERYWDYGYDNVGQLKSAKGTDHAVDFSTMGYTDTPRLQEQFGYAYDAGANLQQRTNNALVQTFTVDNNNQLSNSTRSGTLTVAGHASQNRGGDYYWGYPVGVSNVTVSGTGLSSGSAAVYSDGSWARTGATPANGNNTYTATARDTSDRTATDSVTVNLPATVTFQYDANGNLTNDGRRVFEYDYENQLTSVAVAGAWRSEFQQDVFGRRRVRREFSWQGGVWTLTNEVRYVYDGMLVVQERDGLNLPRVSYTRGNDLSGSLAGAGGIGGLLAMTRHSTTPATHSYYHTDGNGNVTAMASGRGTVVARYHYDPFGNLLGQSGPLAEANTYRFSSKEWHANSGLYYYGYRYYEPNLQRWINRDPLGDIGSLTYKTAAIAPNVDSNDSWEAGSGFLEPWTRINRNLYGAIGNNPIGFVDAWGLDVFACSRDVDGSYGAGAHTWTEVLDSSGNKTTFSGINDKGKLGVRKNYPADSSPTKANPETSRIKIPPPNGMSQKDWDEAVKKSGAKEMQKDKLRGYKLLGGDGGNKSGNCHVVTREVIEGAGGNVPPDYNPPGGNPGLSK